ncbi:MAG: DUF3141 domain-containing protein, partial [Alphaproteobacteria bacterium]
MTTKRPMPPGRELLSKGNVTAQRVLEQSRSMADVVGRHARTLPDALNPKAPQPVVIGNCQGGWAVMMLGASM